jgi:hypothetical protein
MSAIHANPTKVQADERAVVPCNGCSACCRKDAVMLLPDEGDVLATYDYEIRDLPGVGSGPVLKKVDGHCVYLVDGKCSIWHRAPAICRIFDCRRFYLSHPRAERRRLVKLGALSRDVLDAGKARLHTLPEPK